MSSKLSLYFYQKKDHGVFSLTEWKINVVGTVKTIHGLHTTTGNTNKLSFNSSNYELTNSDQYPMTAHLKTR